MLVSLTVGKVDAGVAVLLTEDKRLIEFPSILLPPDIHSGSIVDINVTRNQHAELVADQKFNQLQSDILSTFGSASPRAPVLRCRNATQTSVVLEWDPIDLATAELRSLSLYRNGAKAGNIPVGKLSTKISGLALDTEYTFHLVLRTSAGQYSSEKLTVKTHKMTDLTGITVTTGVMPNPLRESLADTVNRIGAKMVDHVRIDTTHFVCTEPRGQGWEKAVEMNVPVVVPDWVKGCEREGRVVGVRAYYLDADPSKRQIGPSAQQQQQEQERQRTSVSTVQARDSPRIEHTPPTPEQVRPERGFPDRTAPPQMQMSNGTAAAAAAAGVAGAAGVGAAAVGAPAEEVPEGYEKPPSDDRANSVAEQEVDESDDEEDEEAAEKVAVKAADEADAAAAAKSKETDGAGEVEESEDDDGDGDGDGPQMTSVREAARAAMEDDDDEGGEGKEGKFDEVSL